MKLSGQRIVALTAAVVGSVLVVACAVVLLRTVGVSELASNLILTDELRASGHWQLTETKKGVLIRPKAGRYRGWYLDVDERLAPGLTGELFEHSEIRRYLVLSKRARESSYWVLESIPPGEHTLLRSAGGPFAGQYVDIAGLDTPRSRGDLRFARNLLIGTVDFPWKLSRTAEGYTIQATALEFTDWYLDVDGDVSPRNLRGPARGAPFEGRSGERAATGRLR